MLNGHPERKPADDGMDECRGNQWHSRGPTVDLHQMGRGEDRIIDKLQREHMEKWHQTLCFLIPSCSSCASWYSDELISVARCLRESQDEMRTSRHTRVGRSAGFQVKVQIAHRVTWIVRRPGERFWRSVGKTRRLFVSLSSCFIAWLHLVRPWEEEPRTSAERDGGKRVGYFLRRWVRYRVAYEGNVWKLGGGW
jgi:hypothetical protein